MSTNTGNVRSGGIGFFGALGILFIGLKLTGFIDWPWWVVLSPLWGGFVLWLVLVTVVVIGAICADLNNQRKWKR